MMNVSDATLLNQFTRGENPAAFDELAARHADWVYSAALRLVHDAHLAEDITQAVFLLLAQNAARLGNRPVNAWLFKVTRYCAANALRIDRRRRQHERTAAMLKSDSMDAEVQPIWEQMVPLLEESISHLKSEDRQALLLRFYQRKSLADVGAAMGISEDAAQKRVAKAVEKLRSLMSGKGVLIPAVVAASALLFEQTAHAAPAGLVARCIPGAASAGAVQIAQGVNKMLLLSKLKLAIVAALLITAVPLGFWTALHAAGANQITTPNQTAGPAPTAPPFGPAGEQSMSVAAADAAIAPFCNSHTQMIISFNLSDIDPDALAGWLQTN
ncbi:MAG TPA: sigma-70 family RNA polymerase sigma factor, partial [Phycisphaerae bacterium]|nr:sigma-70 family RNA polymerase sigma factor [Phycisphaerae bacterium]